jgi:parallel beta-helix repeat protein
MGTGGERMTEEKNNCSGAPDREEAKEGGGMNENKNARYVPIHICGNKDFADQASKNGWRGNGTKDNPYIIENYEIDASGSAYGIWIENTDVWFVIRNCKIRNARGISTGMASELFGKGIYLNNVQHGTLENNDCSWNEFYGIYLNYSDNNIIKNNNCRHNKQGISLSSSNYNIISNNDCSHNTEYGIHLSSSNDANIVSNNCSHNEHGIFIDKSIRISITNNNCSYNSNGIALCVSYDNYIKDNNSSYNSGYGIYIFDASNNIIEDNTLYSNSCKNIHAILPITEG